MVLFPYAFQKIFMYSEMIGLNLWFTYQFFAQSSLTPRHNRVVPKEKETDYFLEPDYKIYKHEIQVKGILTSSGIIVRITCNE